MLFLSIALSLYYAWLINYTGIQSMRLLMLVSILLFYVSKLGKGNNVFICLLLLFIGDYLFTTYNNYFGQHNSKYVLLGNIMSLAGYTLLLIYIFKEQKFKWQYRKNSYILFFFLIASVFVIYQYFKFMQANYIGLTHSNLSLLFPVIKVILLNVILGYYLFNKNLSSSLFIICMLSFLLADITQISQYLFFMNNQIKALAILDVSFYTLGIYLLTQFFLRPENGITIFD